MNTEAIKKELEEINTRALELQAIFDERPWSNEELKEIHEDAKRDLELRAKLEYGL